jgi:hypothetical protein
MKEEFTDCEMVPFFSTKPLEMTGGSQRNRDFTERYLKLFDAGNGYPVPRQKFDLLSGFTSGASKCVILGSYLFASPQKRAHWVKKMTGYDLHPLLGCVTMRVKKNHLLSLIVSLN